MMVKRIFRYLRDKESLGIVYKRNSDDIGKGELVGHTDSYWAGSPDRKSTVGSVIF